MTMKLPLILSAMLAAFALSGTNASESTTNETTTTTKESATEMSDATAPAPADAKPMAKKKGKKMHHHRHRNGGSGHMADKWDAPWDYIQQGGWESSGCSGDSSSEESPQMSVREIPGEPTHENAHKVSR